MCCCAILTVCLPAREMRRDACLITSDGGSGDWRVELVFITRAYNFALSRMISILPLIAQRIKSRSANRLSGACSTIPSSAIPFCKSSMLDNYGSKVRSRVVVHQSSLVFRGTFESCNASRSSDQPASHASKSSLLTIQPWDSCPRRYVGFEAKICVERAVFAM